MTLPVKYAILIMGNRDSFSKPWHCTKPSPTPYFAEPWQEVLMLDPDSEKFPAKLQYRLITSPAFIDLKPASKFILTLFYYEIKFESYGRKKKWVAVNENNISLPYKEIRERIGYSDMTIWRAIQDILAHGFLNIAHYGGKAKGDFTIYCVKSQWENWIPGKVYFKTAPSRKIGFQRRVGM